MFYLGALILAGYVLLWLAASRGRLAEATARDVPPQTEKLLAPFYRMGSLLLHLAYDGRGRALGTPAVRRRLGRLKPSENEAGLAWGYYVRKCALSMAFSLVGTVLGCLVKWQVLQSAHLQGGEIFRGSYAAEDQEVLLRAKVDQELEQEFSISVKGQIPDWEEADRLEDAFWEEMERVALGENASWEEVTDELDLVECLEGYPFEVEWASLRPDLVDAYGWVRSLEDGGREEAVLTAHVRYGEWEWEHERPIVVTALPKTEQEELHDGLESLLAASEESSRTRERWKLPTEWEGHEIQWTEKQEDLSMLLWGLGIVAAAGSFFLADRDLGAKVEEKERQLKEAYPLIVNKLLLYVGAGMNVRSALSKIAGDYTADRSRGGPVHPAYEELLYTCRELQAGVSEATAYENLGKRSGVQEYVRFCALLSQNLKKGSGMLKERLSEEARRSGQEQMNRFRQKGEMVSTKLLVPMVMMLGIVMVMIMIPAFGSF